MLSSSIYGGSERIVGNGSHDFDGGNMGIMTGTSGLDDSQSSHSVLPRSHGIHPGGYSGPHGGMQSADGGMPGVHLGVHGGMPSGHLGSHVRVPGGRGGIPGVYSGHQRGMSNGNSGLGAGMSGGYSGVRGGMHGGPQHSSSHGVPVVPGDLVGEQGGETSGDWKVFVGMIPRSYSPDQVRALFDPFGSITEVHLMCNQKGLSKGCAFVRYSTFEAAQRSITALNGLLLADGNAINVRFADRDSRTKQGIPAAPSTIPVSGFHNSSGDFVTYPSAGGSQMMHHQQYLGAHQNQHIQIPQQSSHSLAPVSTVQTVAAAPPPVGHEEYFDLPQQSAQDRRYRQERPPLPPAPYNWSTPQEGPEGANLFIYHIPREVTDKDLYTLFQGFGPLLSAMVFVDKATNTSKGFGFVSYENPDDAAAAIHAMNKFRLGHKYLKVEIKRRKMDIF